MPDDAVERVRVTGKQFAVGGETFLFRGITYGTFSDRGDGALFPRLGRLRADIAQIASAGFTVIRTYTEPTEDLLDLAATHGLRVLAGIHWNDWRYLVGAGRKERRELLREGERTVRAAAERLAGNPAVLAVCIGNEIPADVVRWEGTRPVSAALSAHVELIKSVDPDLLVTYANYPTAEYLDVPNLDFVTFNVFLENAPDFRRYINRLQNLSGDRPLVLGEMGLDAAGTEAGEARQAATINWQLRTACERGVAGTCLFSWTDEWAVGGNDVTGWHFGLTREDRTPKPAYDIARAWNTRTVADLAISWPKISVIVCAFNAEATLAECLRHATALDYPDFEVVVVDDGSEDSTAQIVAEFPSVRYERIEHGGLSRARNAGIAVAWGDVIAYLDSDAYPAPQWLHYVAAGFDSPDVAGVGGPNLPPCDGPEGEHRVAAAPGGPIHVLTSDDRAEHIPGCNMAFRRALLAEAGGFDPVYTSAGDDVDLCWRLLDRGWEIAFHPAAVVWHHRRPDMRSYLRQQRGYGRSEALVAARHPDRFTAVGTARWVGHIYQPGVSRLTKQRVYRGTFGAAPFQSVYGGGGHAIDLAHQVGVPLATVTMAVAPLALLDRSVTVVVGTALAFLLALFVVDAMRVTAPRSVTHPLRFRAHTALLWLLQPLARTWGRVRAGRLAAPLSDRVLHGPVTRAPRGVLVLPATAARGDVAAAIAATLRNAGLRVSTPNGWEDHDGRVSGSLFVAAELVTSAYPEGAVRVTLRPRLRVHSLLAATAVMSGLAVTWPETLLLLGPVGLIELARGWTRATIVSRRAIVNAARVEVADA